MALGEEKNARHFLLFFVYKDMRLKHKHLLSHTLVVGLCMYVNTHLQTPDIHAELATGLQSLSVVHFPEK
jgi:hypothetical protein